MAPTCAPCSNAGSARSHLSRSYSLDLHLVVKSWIKNTTGLVHQERKTALCRGHTAQGLIRVNLLLSVAQDFVEL